MKAEIISVGTELLLGHIVNTNAAYLSQKLAELGIDLYHQTTVGDNRNRLAEAVTRSFVRADLVITTGGLGPTADDITAQTLIRIASKKPVKYIRNTVGTAPGLIIEDRGRTIIALPGPPREITPMFEKAVIPYLRRRFKVRSVIRSCLIRTTGLAESRVDRKVRDLLKLGPKTTVGIYAKLGEVDLKITSKETDKDAAGRAISKIEKVVKKRLKSNIFGYDDDTLEATCGRILTGARKTIAVAESCTGGLVSSRLTDVSGSSKYFVMGIIAYSNAVKVNMLGVYEESLKKYGAVSRKVALEMARGVRFLADVDIGIGVTGIAGPTGGTKRKPVGLVYIALVSDKKRKVRGLKLKGSRREIKSQASQVALDMIRRNA